MTRRRAPPAWGHPTPLDRLAVREISSRYLSEDERIQIADLRRDGVSVATIANT